MSRKKRVYRVPIKTALSWELYKTYLAWELTDRAELELTPADEASTRITADKRDFIVRFV
jgi:hypothetical protein